MSNLNLINDDALTNKLYCLNCGKKGHLYKKCIYPNHCFNCKEEEPYCCCYDSQCKDC